MKVYIVIPTYNESHNIEPLVGQILGAHPNFNILIVDDNSPDGTGAIADAISARDPRVHVHHRPRKAGLGTAYIEGFKKALADGADLIFEMDADFSHDVKYLKDFLVAVQTADLVIGSRYINGVRVEGWRFRRLLLSKLANMYVSYVMVKPVWDFTAGYRCYKREVLEAIDLDKVRSDGYAFQIELTYLTFKHGFTVAEIPITFKERQHGVSKISRNVAMEAFWLTLRCHAPIMEIIKHLSFICKDYTQFVENKNHYRADHA
ncbi:MAG: Undecaprenyl-phosphate mannosyltransferase [Syntrophorhabdus sp. PtaB.Bin006]|nr:MAG: Undecaprenyl-phosphate mannosyltransferase [Syntrophorhabdus sp. PtaB.Bin006]